MRRADPSVASAARSALAARLARVRETLTRAVTDTTDPEHVHKLRVATRRATAALDAFAERLPTRTYRQTRRELRDIRRAAGAARDWDVFFAAVSARATDHPHAALLGWAAAKRDSAAAALDAVAAAHPGQVNRLLSTTVSAVTRPGDLGPRTLPELARAKLAPLVQQLARSSGPGHDDDEGLHAVRIAGKRLRYAVEVFGEWVPDGFRQRLTPTLKAVQDVLGRFNDAVTAARHLEAFAAHFRAFHPAEWEQLRPGVEALAAECEAARQTERQGYFDWRGEWLAVGGPAALVDLLEQQEELGR